MGVKVVVMFTSGAKQKPLMTSMSGFLSGR